MRRGLDCLLLLVTITGVLLYFFPESKEDAIKDLGEFHNIVLGVLCLYCIGRIIPSWIDKLRNAGLRSILRIGILLALATPMIMITGAEKTWEMYGILVPLLVALLIAEKTIYPRILAKLAKPKNESEQKTDDLRARE